MINLKTRLKNPVFLFHIALAIITPILAYAGISSSDITSWGALGDLLKMAVSNPYVLSLVVVNVWGTVTDPTTEGFGDSGYVLYKEAEEPYDEETQKFLEENSEEA